MKTITTKLATYTVERDDTYGFAQWNIYRDDQFVNFTLREDNIENAIHFFEYGDNIDPCYFTGVTNG